MIEAIFWAVLLLIIWSFLTIGLIVLFAPFILLVAFFVLLFKFIGDGK
jgi:hypothetical protein